MLRFLSLAMIALLLMGCGQSNDTNRTVETNENTTAETDTNLAAEEDTNRSASAPIEAQCKLEPVGDSGVSGTIHLVEEDGEVKITGEISGLSPGEHGFHVHEKGDLSDKEKGESAGGHFNPTNEPHGRPSDEERHVGDLGNVEANDQGVATVDMTDSKVSLEGEHSIIGRALVVHSDADQFTQPSGDAGGRVAFGKIQVVNK